MEDEQNTTTQIPIRQWCSNGNGLHRNFLQVLWLICPLQLSVLLLLFFVSFEFFFIASLYIFSLKERICQLYYAFSEAQSLTA